MICNHIKVEECVERVPRTMFRKKQFLEENNLFLETNSNRGKYSKNYEAFKTFCYECDNCKKSLMCLCCGSILCGRDDSGHAIDHFRETSHPVVMDCITFDLYCYSCDDDVLLDFEPSLYSVIKSLKMLFERDDVMEGGDGPTITTSEVFAQPLINGATVFHQKVNVIHDKKGSKKRRNKKGKVSPMLDSPTVADCNVGPLTNGTNNRTALTSSNGSALSDAGHRPRGLRNIGLTCYMNAVLQSLACIAEFREYIMSLPSLEDFLEDEKQTKNGNFYLTDEFRKLLIQMSARNFHDPVVPHDFRECFVLGCPRFRGYRQHDSHEFMRYLLDSLQTEMRKCRHLPEMNDEDKMTPISKYFEGVLQSSVICQNCQNCSNKMDVFMDLSLDIPRFKNITRLSDCLTLFFQREFLEKGEKPECSKCKSKQTCSKQMFIKKLPQVLCLHIKRFRDNGGKLDTLIDFPVNGLSVDDFLTDDSDEPPCVYDLQSIIIHLGFGCSSGHYVAVGRRGNKWYMFDDNNVKTMDESSVAKQKPYVLLYTKRTRKP